MVAIVVSRATNPLSKNKIRTKVKKDKLGKDGILTNNEGKSDSDFPPFVSHELTNSAEEVSGSP